MQNEVFDFQGQKWVARRGCGELMLSLGHSKDPNTALHVHIDVDLVPSWVRDQEGEDGMGTVDEHRHMHLAVSGNMPAIGRWQDLAGVVLEDRDEVMAGDVVICAAGAAGQVRATAAHARTASALMRRSGQSLAGASLEIPDKSPSPQPSPTGRGLG